MSYPGRIFEFASVVLAHWFAWVSAVPFFIDKALSTLPAPRLKLLVDHYLPEPRRHRLVRVLAVFGFAVASFLAFDEVNTQKKKLESELLDQKNLVISALPTKITEVTNKTSYTALPTDEWIAIKNSERLKTTVILPSGFPRGKVIVVKNTEDNPAMNPVMVRSETSFIDGFEAFPIDSAGSTAFLWDGNRW